MEAGLNFRPYYFFYEDGEATLLAGIDAATFLSNDQKNLRYTDPKP